ncbi:origin recognition complex subunit 2 [Fistulina hepatica ATCC 64428]|uniref:Origin recognition complex subunit 2 n=1 Tax=Fistulina hepatica ATCC 64428 TaxID=1128425 RepID=A0A0D7A7U8_9AGAR|nr:origin recognition complex subunit 2 [Fistulina hepatica ATCC 64428]
MPAPRKVNEDAFISDESDVDHVSSGSSDDIDDEPVLSVKARGKRKADNDDDKRFIVETSFDAYFMQSSARAQTSSNVFSSLVEPLSAEEYSQAMSEFMPSIPPWASVLLTSDDAREAAFTRMMRELHEGFNILCYGFGSKRQLLNRFAMERCAKAGYTVVVNGFQTSFTLKELFDSIERVPGLDTHQLTSNTAEGQAKRVGTYFSTTKRHLFLIIHNIDGPVVRTARVKSVLASLAICPRIHIVASIDHVNAPLLWSSAEASTRKADADMLTARGFNWLWHDFTTLSPYDVELSHANRGSISGAHARGKRAEAIAAAAIVMTEIAAIHILASVTEKAKRLFAMIARRQLESIHDASDGDGNTDLQRFAVGYDVLFKSARDQFIATNDTSLRSLLGEFRDHGLVLSAQTGPAGEELWIPLRKERLSNVLKTIPAE